ncbi:MAG: beta-ketoacyl synthase [Arenicella sp.]
MTRLPVIVGFGGINAAGRSSSHHAYRRMVIESLPGEDRQETLAGLAVMMGLLGCVDGEYRDDEGQVYSLADIEEKFGETILQGTLVRRIESSYFDINNVIDFGDVELQNCQQSTFKLPKRKLPSPLPEGWNVTEINARNVEVTVTGELSLKIETSRKMDVHSAGQLPSGFDPASLYKSRYHPRGLQMTVVAASDAVNSIGVSWQTVMDSIAPDQIAVYASSSLSQLDEHSFAGMLQSRLRSKRVSSKQMPMGMNNMPADFVNAYVCGSLGTTGSMTGACASFLYNLRLAVDDIRDGRRRVVIVGGSEAPISSEVIEGFDAMSALAKAEQLRKLDAAAEADLRRASRPFGENCGFTIAESAQYIVLMDDALAIELGANIHGAVNDVFVNADGFKKSISAPGPGNYATLAKAVASARAIVGDEAIQQRSFIQAHGSSTPQNRVTESVIFDKVASAFGIEKWPVSAVKSYLGHSLGSASGDQLVAALGVFAYGVLPGIKTIEKVADDVVDERLVIRNHDVKLEQTAEVAFLNSKGFGGNNATASILAPQTVNKMLTRRYGTATMQEYEQRRIQTQKQVSEYDQAFLQGDYRTIYKFGENLVDENDIELDQQTLSVPGYQETIDLNLSNPYQDMSS